MPKVLFIGLGTMGYPMAGHLSKNYEVTVYNRTVSKSIKWIDDYEGFYIEDLKAINSKIVGEKHIKSVLIGPEGTSIKTIAFNAVDNELGVYLLKKKANIFNIAGKLSLNEWRGQKNVEFIIDDISVNKNHKNTVPSSIG